MKTNIKFLLSLYLILTSASLFSQEIYIENVKFVSPVIEKWINEYRKENPDFRLQIASGQGSEEASLRIVANTLPDDDASHKIIYIGRYALVPVSNVQNPLLEKARKGLKKKELVDLIFEKDLFDDNYDPEEKAKYTATVYSRSNEAPTALTLAGHFNQTGNSIKGKKIFGDDIYLLHAVQKDPNGVAFNTLNYVYDLTSRRLKTNLSLLPLNLKQKQKEAWESGNIDHLIALLEETPVETIPVENIGFYIPKDYIQNKEITEFVHWILEKGLTFSHEYGLLHPDKETLAFQKARLKDNKSYLSYTTDKRSSFDNKQLTINK